MIREKLRVYSILNFIGDSALLIISFTIGYLIRWHYFKPNFPEHFFKVSVALIFGWVLVTSILKLYDPDRFEQFEKSFAKHFQAIVIHAMLLSTLVLLIKPLVISKPLFIYGYSVFIFSDTLLRLCFLYLLKKERKSGKNSFRVIVVGNGQIGRRMYETLSDYSGYGFKPLGIFDDRAADPLFKLNGSIEDAKQFAVKNNVDEIFCALPLSETEKVNDLLHFAEDNLIRFKVVPDFSAFQNRMVSVDFYGFVPVISLRPEPLSNVFNRILKRSFDILFSSLVMILILSWLIPVVALLIKFDSKGSVFYIQNRSGRNYKMFRIIKFRTMSVTQGDHEYIQAKKNDARITRIGKVLRKLNIDELPQFINVFLGNMSVVGPRPHPVKLNETYRPLVEKYMIRHLAQPGITGLAQVRGFRGETSDPAAMQKRVMADVFYIENWSFLLDTKIILLTLWNMVKGEKNAY